MNILKKVILISKKFVLNKDIRFQYLDALGVYNHLSDEDYLKKRFKINFGYSLNLENPKTFNEKIQWLKLYDRKPEYTQLVDKASVKEIVASKIGNEYIIPTLGVWERFNDIDFGKLPSQFVLKCTHDSGGIVICTDKSKFDVKAAQKKMNKSLRNNYYLHSREWPYKDVKPRIIAEPYMEDKKTGELRDYKFFTFSGEAKAVFIATGRQNTQIETTFDFFDMNYNHLDFTNGHPNAKILPEKPQNFEKMKVLAEILADGIPHVRVDFYEVNGAIYFGELTFAHWSGMVPFTPESWDYIFGSWIKLPKRISSSAVGDK